MSTSLVVASHTHAAPIRQRASARGALASLSVGMLIPSLDTSIANAGLPALATAFHASFQAVQWVVLAYLLAITTTIVAAGRLGDTLGRRRLLLAGITLFTAASLLCAVAPTLAVLVVGRAVQGLGAAVMMALILAFVRDTVPEVDTGRAMGWLGTMSAAGTTLGPSLGGLLVAVFGWRALFIVAPVGGALAGVLVWRYLPGDVPRASAVGRAFDRGGATLLALTLGAYALAMTLGRGQFGAQNVAWLVLAAAGASLFVVVEIRAAAPLIPLAMLRETALAAGLAMSALVSTVIMTTLVVGPFYLMGSLGLAAAPAGLALSLGPFVAALTGVVAGRLADRHGARRMTVLGLAGMTGGCAALALMPAAVGLVGYLASVGMMTASYAVFQAANNSAVMTVIDEGQRGVTAGLLNLSRYLGLITGAAAMGAVFAAVAQSADVTTADPVAIAAGMRRTFAVATMLLVAALAVAAGSRARYPSGGRVAEA